MGLISCAMVLSRSEFNGLLCLLRNCNLDVGVPVKNHTFIIPFVFCVGARRILGLQSSISLASGPIHLDNVECRGDEQYLVNCTSLGFLQHDCTHFEDAGVVCEGEVLNLIM